MAEAAFPAEGLHQFVGDLGAEGVAFVSGLLMLLRHFDQFFLHFDQAPVRFQVVGDRVCALWFRLAVGHRAFSSLDP
jgi:hypothetical protein